MEKEKTEQKPRVLVEKSNRAQRRERESENSIPCTPPVAPSPRLLTNCIFQFYSPTSSKLNYYTFNNLPKTLPSAPVFLLVLRNRLLRFPLCNIPTATLLSTSPVNRHPTLAQTGDILSCLPTTHRYIPGSSTR